MSTAENAARPRLLDLFCKAGGAAQGYADAGFEVVGVDIEPQPNYPFKFFQADALAMCQDVFKGCWHEDYNKSQLPGMLRDGCLGHFDAIHASPPCQDYSVTAALHTAKYPRLIGAVRDVLEASGVPYVIENVAGAKADMRNPVKLCGSSFGLGVRRHRLFETSWPVQWPPPCAHYLQPEPIDVTGTGGPAGREQRNGGGIHRKPRNLAHAREAMGIDWMTRRELSEAIPPTYTAWIGAQLRAHITEAAASPSVSTDHTDEKAMWDALADSYVELRNWAEQVSKNIAAAASPLPPDHFEVRRG